MAEAKVVETIYGKYHKYEIVKKGREFFIRKDGRPHRGSFSSLSAAVEAARKEAGQ